VLPCSKICTYDITNVQDLLADHDPYAVVRQMQLLRRHTGGLPIIYTIRSKGQCGAFPDEPEKIFDLLKWGTLHILFTV
jgi:pentafunctional AROM polypeptide